MQCECQTEIAEILAGHVKKKLPEGYQDFDAKLDGYGFAMQGDKLTAPFMIAYRGEVQVPKKGGNGMKRQKIDTTVTANYCPFCGMAAKAEEEPEAEEEQSTA